MAKNLKFVLLLDCYGELLTDRQRNTMELYYCEDLSLSEIAGPLGVTRQSVRDLIKRTENILLNYEEKLGFADRLGQMRSCFEKLEKTAENVENTEIRKILQNEISVGLSLL